MGSLHEFQWSKEFQSYCGSFHTNSTHTPFEQLIFLMNNPSYSIQDSCSYTFLKEGRSIQVTVDSSCYLQLIAFLARKKNVIRIDLQSRYLLPRDYQPSSDHRRLREYTHQEIMSTREEVQSFYNHGIHGENRLIGLSDTGIDVQNCFFWDEEHAVRYDSAMNDTQHRKIFLYHPFSNDREDGNDSHGTHVAGTLVGEVSSESPFSLYNGIAYKARLTFIDIGSGEGQDSQLHTPRRIVKLIESLYE